MMRKQLSVFLIAGSLTALVDFCVYKLISHFDLVNVASAKTLGFLAGTLFAYVINRLWTFSQQSPAKGSAWRFGLLYVSTLAVNVAVNNAALHLLLASDFANYRFYIAFFIATATSATLNFLGMKFFVFKPTNASEDR